jgi:hypothetical protein
MKRLRALLLIALCSALLTGVARADIIFEDKNDPQPGEENIQFQTDQVGPDITGFTNHSDIAVLFHSDLNTLETQGVGQAQIVNHDGGNLNQILVSAPGYQFHDFIVDLNGAADALINVTVFANDGQFNHQIDGKNGSNFITIIATNGEEIDSVLFESELGWKTFKQPRISGLEQAAVPEPGTLLMLGSGAMAFAAMLRRKLS